MDEKYIKIKTDLSYLHPIKYNNPVTMKKLLALFLAIGVMGGGLITVPHAHAVTQDEFNQSLTAGGMDSRKWTFEQYGSGLNSITALILGHPEVNQTMEDKSLEKSNYKPGAVQNLTSAIAYMYENKPADTQTFVADALNSAGIVTPARAQGLGFASLNPILDTWKIFRNTAYLFFVVVFLVIGFLIMLRQKIGAQTVVTAQLAIPQVIVALLMVTFSYAIAGLLIDFMYLVMYLMLALFGRADMQAEFLNQNFLSLGFSMTTKGAETAYEATKTISNSIEKDLGDFWTAATNVISIGVGLIAGAIIAIAIATNVFKLFFTLLKTYVTIILSIAFAPLLLMMGAIPGKNTFGEWIKNLVGNLAAFPLVLGILLVFDMLTGNISNLEISSNLIEGGGFVPPYLYGGALAEAGGGVLPFLIGLGMIMIMPELVEKGKEALGAKKGVFDQFAGNIGDAMKRGIKGGELIPGLGVTNTSKYGLSGEQLSRAAGVGAAGATGYLGGGALGVGRTVFKGEAPRRIPETASQGWRLGGRSVADLTNSDLWKKNREERKKTSKWDATTRLEQLKSEEGK